MPDGSTRPLSHANLVGAGEDNCCISVTYMNKWAPHLVSGRPIPRIQTYISSVSIIGPVRSCVSASGTIRRKQNELDADLNSADQWWRGWEHSRRLVEEVQSGAHRQHHCRDTWRSRWRTTA